MYMSNAGVTGWVWVGGEFSYSLGHHWKRSGTPIDISMWPGGVESSSTSEFNMKKLEFPGSSPASTVAQLGISGQSSSFVRKALCEEELPLPCY